MSKAIVMFADGTGNARTARFRTNVWKMYSALDLSAKAGQIAYYIDGVGTSAFAPLRLLGGIFGVGVKRNVRELYGFLCRNYCPGDRIYVFGFSRGAFTARLLAGLVARVGIMRIDDDLTRSEWVDEAFLQYRQQVSYRSRAKLSRAVAWIGAKAQAGFRSIRRSLLRPPPISGQIDNPPVSLVGCWDTVSAYGGPITELVRAWDQYVTPLSLPDYRLHPNIERARHALALDEEREAFLPLLWDEQNSQAPDRIKQVWFAGVHSDVGGGYADRGLSAIPLAWMIGEAQAAGLVFDPAAVAKINRVADPTAPMHDSRGGVGAFYRYQPRRISELAGTRPSVLRDPVSGKTSLLRTVAVHPSVLQRISGGCDGYAPLVLPTTFDVAGRAGSLNIDGQEQIWRQVAYRRMLQFLLLSILFFASFAPLATGVPVADYLNQAWTPAFTALFGAVPGVPAWAAAAYGGSGLWVTLAAVAVAVVLRLAERRRLAIVAAARQSWRFEAQSQSEPPTAGRTRGINLLNAFRRWWKWTALPAVIGALYYAILLGILVACLSKVTIAWRETRGVLCDPAQGSSASFDTAALCQPLAGPALQQGHRYYLRIAVAKAWSDGSKPATPKGFSLGDSVDQAWRDGDQWLPARFVRVGRRLVAHGLAVPARRVLSARWFEPVIAIRPMADGGDPCDTSALIREMGVPMGATSRKEGVFYGEFTAPVSGRAYMFVNDAIIPLLDGDTGLFYGAGPGLNKGSAQVTISPIDAARQVEGDGEASACQRATAGAVSAAQTSPAAAPPSPSAPSPSRLAGTDTPSASPTTGVALGGHDRIAGRSRERLSTKAPNAGQQTAASGNDTSNAAGIDSSAPAVPRRRAGDVPKAGAGTDPARPPVLPWKPARPRIAGKQTGDGFKTALCTGNAQGVRHAVRRARARSGVHRGRRLNSQPIRPRSAARSCVVRLSSNRSLHQAPLQRGKSDSLR